MKERRWSVRLVNAAGIAANVVWIALSGGWAWVNWAAAGLIAVLWAWEEWSWRRSYWQRVNRVGRRLEQDLAAMLADFSYTDPRRTAGPPELNDTATGVALIQEAVRALDEASVSFSELPDWLPAPDPVVGAVPYRLDTCWREGCGAPVRREDELGLCERCKGRAGRSGVKGKNPRPLRAGGIRRSTF